MAMKEFVISEAKVETAVLVGLVTQTQNERKTEEYLDELAFLAETAGAKVVKRFTQKLDQPNSVTYVGKGKLDEIKAYIESALNDLNLRDNCLFLNAFYRKYKGKAYTTLSPEESETEKKYYDKIIESLR